jgi:polysaccharide biosynthesis transport protein
MNSIDMYRRNELVPHGTGPSVDRRRDDAQSDRLDLRGIIAIFRRRLLMFVTIVLICVMLAFLFTIKTPKMFTASADVVMKADATQVTPSTPPAAEEPPRRGEQIDTELQLITSRELAGKVYDGLKLSRDQQFLEMVGTPSGTLNLIARTFGISGKGGRAMPDREAVIDYLVRSLESSRIGTAFAMRISYSNPDPQRAARIANGYAAIYTGDQVTAKQADNEAAITILKSRMEELRTEAQADFGAVQQFRIGNDLLSRNAASLTENEVSAYNQQVAIARAEAAEDRERLVTARRQLAGGVGAMGEAQSSPVVQSLRGQRAAFSIKVAELASRYLDSHPALINARQQLVDIDAQINTEVMRTLFALDAKAKASAQRLSSLESSLGSARRNLSANNGALVPLDDLERRAQASQALYESYLNRYKEAVARSGAEQADSRLLSVARVPGRPSSPNMPLNLALGLLVGTLLGAGSSVLAETNYAGLTTGEDVEDRIGVAYFGGIPLLTSLDLRSATPLKTIADHPGGAYAESLRNVLTSLRQSNISRNQVIAISSALPGEGKTTLSSGLARVAGLAGERVALVDCDAVRSSLSRLYPRPKGAPGLREVLHDGIPIEAARLVDSVGNVSVFGITTPFADGERLMDNGKLNRLIAKLREQYDLIIIDCPPILPIAEARELVTLSDSVAVVALWRKSGDRAVLAALKLLPLTTISHIGVVLNAIDMRKRIRFGDGDASAFYNRYKDYYGAN